MTYHHAAASYREREVLTATPGKLVIIVYDYLLMQLRRTQVAMDAGNAELRVESTARARAALGELMATLDTEAGGGALARQLGGLYAFFITELMDLGLSADSSKLERISMLVLELRSAFATAESAHGERKGATAA